MPLLIYLIVIFKKLGPILAFIAFAFMVAMCSHAEAANTFQLTELRHCGPPARTASGAYYRDPAVTREFQRQNPCPSTGLRTGNCPRWEMDHVKPLACGGCDAVFNMQWLDEVAKTRKDGYERSINPPTEGASPTCKLRLPR